MSKIPEAAYVQLLNSSAGMEAVRAEIDEFGRNPKAWNDFSLRPEDVQTLKEALELKWEQFHLISPSSSGLDGILFKLFRGKLPDLFSPREGALVVEKSFERIGAIDAKEFILELEKRGDLSSVELAITKLDLMRARFLGDLVDLGRKFLQQSGTRLYAVTSPEYADGGGDIFIYNFSIIRRHALRVLSQPFDSITTFYAQGRDAQELTRIVATLDPNCPSIPPSSKQGGGQTSGGPAQGGGASDPSKAGGGLSSAACYRIGPEEPNLAPAPVAEYCLSDANAFFPSNVFDAGGYIMFQIPTLHALI